MSRGRQPDRHGCNWRAWLDVPPEMNPCPPVCPRAWIATERSGSGASDVHGHSRGHRFNHCKPVQCSGVETGGLCRCSGDGLPTSGRTSRSYVSLQSPPFPHLNTRLDVRRPVTAVQNPCITEHPLTISKRSALTFLQCHLSTGHPTTGHITSVIRSVFGNLHPLVLEHPTPSQSACFPAANPPGR